MSRTLALLAVFLCASVATAEEPKSEESKASEESEASEKESKKEKKKKKKQKMKDSRKPRVSGYVQAYYKHRLDTNDMPGNEPGMFRLQRVRVQVEGYALPWVSYQVEIDPRAPTIGGVLRDGYFELHVIRRHRIRIGQQKTQFGYENRESSSRLYTATRSEVAEGPSRGITLRDLGVGLIGKWPLGGGFSLEDAITVVNGAGMNVQADTTQRKNVWGRVGVRYRDKDRELDARLGVSGAMGDQLEPDDPLTPLMNEEYTFDFVRAGVDVEVDSKWAFAAAEVVISSEDPSDPDATTEQLGWYVLVAGKTPWDVGPVFRYDTLDTEEFSRFTFGAYWGGPDKALRAMLQYEIWEDEAGPHDHRLHLWSQVRF